MLIQSLIDNLCLLLVLFVALWCVSLRTRDVSIVDIFWGLGFVVLATATWFRAAASDRSLVLFAMVCLWGLRLSGYLAWRNHGKDEDYRYAAMRKKHGDRFAWVSLWTVFLLQGALVWFISLPVQLGLLRGAEWDGTATLGVLLWGVGLFFESVGDFQLARFKADPKNQGRVLTRGLWRYTRHPNYFGDFLVWWGIFCVAWTRTQDGWTVISPLVMSFLLLRVSGVKLLESSLRTRVAGYESYVERTSAFFPLPPKTPAARPGEN